MTPKPTILIVDDEDKAKKILKINLANNYNILLASNGEEALNLLKKSRVQLILTDLNMPQMNGLKLLEWIQQNRPEIPVVLVTAYGTVENAVEAMKKGAIDYILKPIKIEELRTIIEKTLHIGKLIEENVTLKEKLQKYEHLNEIVFADKKIQDILNTIDQVAKTPVPVLIEGESGTGKSFFAKAVHFLSDRSKKPFIELNCGAIPHDLIESELFGHEKGAFTGAVQQKKGKFELADGGTLFLDEIGELPLDLQVKLLHVVETQKFTRVGGTSFIETNVRLISATNRNLKEEIENNRFRQDLYYRLKVVYLYIPPLRERKDDIPVLANHFLKKHASLNPEKNLQLTKETITILKSYSWNGNIREMENILQQAIILSKDGIITPGLLPPELTENFQDEVEQIPLTKIELTEFKEKKTKYIIDNIEYRFLTNLLQQAGGNITKAAEISGYDRRQIQNLINKHGINSATFK